MTRATGFLVAVGAAVGAVFFDAAVVEAALIAVAGYGGYKAVGPRHPEDEILG